MNLPILDNMDKEKLQQLRRDYILKSLDENEIEDHPIKQFQKWFGEALAVIQDDPNAMTLATVDKENQPHARVVLLKEIKDSGFVFYSNYNSNKSKDLHGNPNAALSFFWPSLERQIRIEGKVERLTREESEKYFYSRPYKSQIGALASHQSQVVESRKQLEERFNQLSDQYEEGKVPMPEWWGGFILIPDSIEFWQGRTSRLHDRIKYVKEEESWQIQRLSP